jgi:hypothetical protein
LATPLLIGIYEEGKLVKTIEEEGKTSYILPRLFKEILESYQIGSVAYVNGPGSYMAIKVSYTFLKTLSIVKGFELLACDGFAFNGGVPIKALGKKYFIKDENGIILDFIKNESELKGFELPGVLDKNIFSRDSLPNYNLPAVI